MYTLSKDQHKAHKARLDQTLDWSQPVAPGRDELAQRKDGTFISRSASPLVDSEVVVAGFLRNGNSRLS
jgi:hypothetical protein